MAKKVLTIIGDEIGKVRSYKEQLRSIFQDNIIIKELIYDESIKLNDNDLAFDVGLICSGVLFPIFKPLAKKNSLLVMFKRTISKYCFDKLKKVSSGKNVAVYAGDAEMEIVLITKLYTMGLLHLNFYPYKEINKTMEFIDVIAIFDEEKNSTNYPTIHDNVIYVGQSMLDMSTIMDVATKLDLEEIVFNKDIENSYKGLKSTDFGFSDVLDKAKLCESYMDILLKIANNGVIGIDAKGTIKNFNREAGNILKVKPMTFYKKNAFELFDFIPFNEVLETQEPITNVVVKHNETNMIISVGPVFHSGKLYGALATFKKYSDLEKEQYKIRAKIMDKGHMAKYTFDDIIGISDEINKCKIVAKNMAKSNSSVLITGESGTGKELFAQSIHNSSNRKSAPFVAINCGALPENLLESELFGYEEGAFTGAKKGGKQGLFELAHNGTIFLDEIAEMPIHLQLKLLRVIQEREIMRIGADNIIKIDIRIIAATNKDIEKLIESNEFREDLYYRLNVLPLKIPPLRSRRKDITPLFNYMKDDIGGIFELSNEAQAKIEAHTWKGNVRELQNIVEYLCNLNYKLISPEDIPFSDNTKDNINLSINERDIEIINKLFIFADGNIENYIFVLKTLKNNKNNIAGLGRRTIYENALLNKMYLSESKIRRIIIDLSDLDMIRVSKGRGGCHITDFGLKSLNYLERLDI